MKDPAGNAAPSGGFQNGGWYSGYQYFNNSFAPKAGQEHPQSGSPTAGQMVSATVNNQTNPNNNAYITAQNSNPNNGGGGSASGASTGGAGTSTSTGGGSLGIGGAPVFDLVAATNAAYNTPEITAANKSVSDANAELITRQQARDTALQNESDNPFYSEGTLVGKQAKINNAYDQDATVIQNKIAQAQGQVASLKADAAIKVNAAQGQYNINNSAYQENLSNFNNLLSAGALDNASGSDIATIATQTGIPTSMIQSMVTQSQKKNNPVQLIQSTDSAGNLNLVAVDSNGKVVNTTTIAGAGKATKGGSGKSETTQNTNNLAQSAASGTVLHTLYDAYKGVLPPGDILSIYNKNSPWGKATETVQDMIAGKFKD